VILVEPEIAPNVGAVGRTCVAVGASLWLVRPLGFLVDDRKIRRAGLDYWEHLDWRVVDHLDEVAEALGRDRLWSFSTRAALPYTEADYRAGDGPSSGRRAGASHRPGSTPRRAAPSGSRSGPRRGA